MRGSSIVLVFARMYLIVLTRGQGNLHGKYQRILCALKKPSSFSTCRIIGQLRDIVGAVRITKTRMLVTIHRAALFYDCVSEMEMCDVRS